MISFITDLRENIKFRSFEMHKFVPQFILNLEVGPYLLKTAETAEELKAAFTLRHQIFFNSAHKERGQLYDIDQFDSLCDHLIILEKISKKIVGTYRLNNSSVSKNFYTSTEFSLQKIVYSGNNCVELGRACIDQDHRNGIVITLLWRGIYNYMKSKNASILFGASSIKGINARQAALLIRYFDTMDLVDTVFKTCPHYSFKVPLLEEYLNHSESDLTIDEFAEVKSILPSLLRSYLKFGAKVAGEPAYDSEMDCVDFLTVMRIENMSVQIDKKFKI